MFWNVPQSGVAASPAIARTMNSLGEVFGRLKPLFEKVVQNPKLAEIKQLNEYLGQIDKSSLQILQNVFLQQLVVVVDNISKE